MTPWKIVSESVNLTEDIMIGAPIAMGTWWLNTKIRTMKVLHDFPTPLDMKAKLLQSDDERVRFIAEELDENMDINTYKRWVAIKVNPKMGVGKAIFMSLGYLITAPWQIGKAAVHAAENPDEIVNRAIKKGRIFQ